MLNGMWQVSGTHGRIDPERAIEAMLRYHNAGFTTWDLADHYGPAEDLIGRFPRRFAEERGAKRLGEIQAFTPTIDALYVPDIDESLDEEGAKQRFWRSFRMLGTWYEDLPPY